MTEKKSTFDIFDRINLPTEIITVIIFIIIGFLLRVWNITSIPPGLWLDEAINGLDAISLLEENPFRIFFQYEIYPREPFYVYCIAPFIWLFGNEPWSIRLASVFLGTATLPAAYLFTREWFDKRTALIALACLVFLRWHLHFSRTGFRTIAAPLFILLGFWLIHRGIRLNKLSGYILSGVCFGAGFYTYLSFRFVPFVFLIWLGSYWFMNRKELPSKLWKGLGYCIAAGTIVILPLVIHYIKVPYHFSGRTEMIQITSKEMMQNAKDVALMFSVKGDHVGKHNIPKRTIINGSYEVNKPPVPVFDILTSIFFYLGIIYLIYHSRKSHGAILILTWFLIMSLNSILSFGAPNLLRTLIMTPAVVIILAKGYEIFYQWDKIRSSAIYIIMICFLSFAGLQTWQYFGIFPHSLNVWYQFNSGFVKYAETVKKFSKDSEIYLPGDIYNHATVKYILHGEKNNIKELTLPEALAKSESNPAGHNVRYILISQFTRLEKDLKQLYPSARYAEIIYDPNNNFLAVVYQLNMQELKPASKIEAYFKDKINVTVFPSR